MSINLTLQFSPPAGAVSSFVQYARIDNAISPTFITVSPNPVTSPATIATNLPNGQYQINATPVYPDGRACNPTTVFTDPCSGLISLSGSITSGVMTVSYLAPSGVPKVRITVNYPNGGSFVSNYVNDGNDITIALPSGLDGIYTLSGQSVCDESTGFYSAPSSQVSISTTSNNLRLTSSAGGIVITSITGIGGFAMPSTLGTGQEIDGTHTAFFAPIAVTFSGTPALSSNAALYQNGTQIQCVNIPNTAGGSFGFSAASFSSTDVLEIFFNTGTCP